MFKNIKIFGYIAAATFLIMVTGSIVGNIIISSLSTDESKYPQIERYVLVIYFILFLILAFSLVPLFIRLFLVLQTKIGNANLSPINQLMNKEKLIVYLFWGLYLLGLLIAMPTLIREFFNA